MSSSPVSGGSIGGFAASAFDGLDLLLLLLGPLLLGLGRRGGLHLGRQFGVRLLSRAELGDGVAKVLEKLHLALREQQSVLVVLHLEFIGSTAGRFESRDADSTQLSSQFPPTFPMAESSSVTTAPALRGCS